MSDDVTKESAEVLSPEVAPPGGLDASQQAKLKEAMSKDAKAGRSLTGLWHWIVAVLGAIMVILYFYSAGFSPLPTELNRGLYVLLTYIMIFLCYPLWSKSNMKRPTIVDIGLVLISIACVGYFMHQYEDYNYRAGMDNIWDTSMSIVGILISIEACRRVLGWSMTLVGIGFLAYAYFGGSDLFPQMIRHSGFHVQHIAVSLYMEQNGVFGIMASVLVTYVILFIFFGAFLQKSGVGRFFIDWPMALAGKSTGGPAKVAVIASAFFGSVSGSAIANTVSTGSFTIPLMKRAGFKPHVAGAIEPSASIGGMFMPPIMGAGGFLMAELTNTPYVDIMKMAVFPALLYFFSVLSMIHFEAKKQGLKGLDDAAMPKARVIFKQHWFKSVPLIIIVVMMLLGFSPAMSAFWATLSCIVISWQDKAYHMTPKAIWEALVSGSRSTLVIGATVGVIGIIVGTIELTGIGLKFSTLIFRLSDGVLPIAILLIGIASLVLGMGVPVTAAYLITAVLAVGPLSDMMIDAGVSHHTAVSAVLAAHMIVYWFSQDSNITPPVCVAAYAGAAIADADPWKTGWTAFKFAKLLYVVPFLFAYEPAILLFGTTWQIIMAFSSAIVGTLAFSSLTMGYLLRRTTVVEWLFFAVATFLLFHTAHKTNLIGFAMFAALYFWQRYKNKRDERMAAAPA